MTAAAGVEAIGVDLGGTKMLIGVVEAAAGATGGAEGRSAGGEDRLGAEWSATQANDTKPQVHHRWEGSSAAESADELLDRLGRQLGEAQRSRPEVGAAGLGIPCTVDRKRGVAVSSVHLPLVDVPIGELLGQRTGLPVFIDNDANVAAIGEHRFGAARGARNVVMLTIGTGIGGGLILDGRPYRGSTGAGAELGHMVIELDGPLGQGSCPSRGCVEALASGTAIGIEGRLAAESEPESALGLALASGVEIDARVVLSAAQEGDRAALGVLQLVGRRLGAALAGLANAFEPDVIVLGGGAMAAGDLLLVPATEEMRARALPPQNKTPVYAAALGADAGMIGAAVMAQAELEAAA